MNPENRYDSLIQFYAGDVLSWLLLKSQIKAESNFDRKAESPAGARGLAQFMAPTWHEWGTKNFDDAFNPEDSIKAQAAYMNWLRKEFITDVDDILRAYNWGIGNVKRWIATDRAAGVLPVETQIYVERINKFWALYANHE